MFLDDHGGLRQFAGRLEFAFGIDHLGPSFPLSFGLSSNRPLHLLGQVNVFQLHRGDFNTPRIVRH
jgi:hypothetical protein